MTAKAELNEFLAAPFGTVTPEARYEYIYEVLQKHPKYASQQHGCTPMVDREHSYFLTNGSSRRGGVRRAFPLMHLLAAKAPLHIIQEVYEMYPAVLSTYNGGLWRPALHVALLYGNTFDVISFLLSKNTKAVYETDKFETNFPLHCALSASLEISQRCTQQHVDKIQLLVDLYPEAIIKSNKHGRTPLHLALTTPRVPAGAVDSLVARLSEDFQELEFHGEFFMSQEHSRNFIQFFPKLQTPKRLELIFVHCTIHVDVLSAMLANMNHPDLTVSLTMKFCNLRAEDVFDESVSWNTCQVNKFVMDTCLMGGALMLWMLRRLQTMNQLTYLQVVNQRNTPLTAVDTTEFATQILLQDPPRRPDNLHICGFSMQLEPVIRLFATNPTLTTNFQYKEDCKSVAPPNLAITYYGVINRHGRARLHNTATSTRRLLVECLVALEADPRVSDDIKPLALYGLLREAPSVWSS